MPFVWKQLGIQTQSVQLWRDAGKDQRPSRDRERKKDRGQVGRSRGVRKWNQLYVKNCVSVRIRGVPYCSVHNNIGIFFNMIKKKKRISR